MSNNASSGSKIYWRPDNPQETLEAEKYYYAGLFAGEMSCSVIRAANYNPAGHFYYAVDVTLTNADKALLENVNKVVMKERGVITPVKGAYNLSARGKERVRIVLDFLSQYPIIAGNLAKNRIALIKNALEYLTTHRGAHKQHDKDLAMDVIRQKLKDIKQKGKVDKRYTQERVHSDAIGYFLAGVLDGEGSFGMKNRGNSKQPYLAVAMKDKEIIDLFQTFLEYGKVRERKDGAYHYEINHSQVLQKVCNIFLTQYPLKHKRQHEKLQALQRILNDYTRKSD